MKDKTKLMISFIWRALLSFSNFKFIHLSLPHSFANYLAVYKFSILLGVLVCYYNYFHFLPYYIIHFSWLLSPTPFPCLIVTSNNFNHLMTDFHQYYLCIIV